MHISRPVALAALAALTACLDKGDYPSLRPRAFEVAGANAPLPTPPPAAPPSAATVAQAAALVTRARAGDRAFSAELARARPVIARAGAADSESWITAQESLSGLDAARADTLGASADLDALTLAGVGADGLRLGEGDFAVIREAGARVTDLVDAQQRTVAELAASLSPA